MGGERKKTTVVLPGTALNKSTEASAARLQEKVLPVERIPVPHLKAKVLSALEGSQKRQLKLREVSLEIEEDPFTVRDPEEKAALALSLSIAHNLMRHAGTMVSEGALERVYERLMRGFSAATYVELEVEAFTLFEWLGEELRPDLFDVNEEIEEEGETIEYDPQQGRRALLERAIRERFDLVMVYYTGGRGEISTRRITPNHIKAEKYLRAYCHTRKEERTFRLSRIANLEPVSGRAVAGLSQRKVGQRGLFDEW